LLKESNEATVQRNKLQVQVHGHCTIMETKLPVLDMMIE